MPSKGVARGMEARPQERPTEEPIEVVEHESNELRHSGFGHLTYALHSQAAHAKGRAGSLRVSLPVPGQQQPHLGPQPLDSFVTSIPGFGQWWGRTGACPRFALRGATRTEGAYSCTGIRRGNSTMNSAPSPGALTRESWPPSWFTISRVRYKPTPSPFFERAFSVR